MSQFLNIRFLNQNIIQNAWITMTVSGKALVVNPATKKSIKFSGPQNNSDCISLGDLPLGLDVHHAISLRFYVSLGSKLDTSAFTSFGAPNLTNTGDPNWNVRWDFFEVTVTPAPGDSGDLSTINGYAIPMMIDTFNEPKPGAPGRGMSTARSYRAGNPYARLQALMTANKANNNYGASLPANGIVMNGSQFVRLIGPSNGGFSTTPATATGGPFPSFNGYLKKVADNGITTKFVSHGTEVPGHTWDLKAGAVAIMNTHQMTLDGTIDGTDFSMRIDADSSVGTPNAMYTWSSMVYQAPGTGTGNPGLHFKINDRTAKESDAVTQFTGAVVDQIYRDVFTGYNLGMIGNQQKVTGWSDPTYGNMTINDMGSDGWRRLALDTVPSENVPLFSKNQLGSGCHNEWASIIYASSTSVYGFAYSEALQHSIPQQSYQLGDKSVGSWLVTILPDP